MPMPASMSARYSCRSILEAVKLERIDDIKHRFTDSAHGANKELGDEMARPSLE